MGSLTAEPTSTDTLARGSRPLEGVRVLILTSGHDVSDPRIYTKQARSLRQLGAEVTITGAVSKSAPTDVNILPVSKAASRLVRFLWQPWKCLWRARRERCDIIHVHDAEMLAVLPAAKLHWPRAKFVYDVHEDFANLMLIRGWLPSWVKPTVKFFVDLVEKTLARLADGIVGVTPPLTDKFANPHRTTAFNYTSSHFFDSCAKVSRPPQQREFDVVHLGTLNLRRASFLCDVLAELQQRRPQTRSLVIGAIAPDSQEFLRSKLPPNSLLLERTGHDQLPALLGNARVGLDVHPWRQPHLEVAIPVKVCEYMAASCAVVCSSMPVLDQVVREAGMASDVRIIEGGTPADYAEAIRGTLEDIEHDEHSGARLRRAAAAHMTWENEADKIAQLYLELLGRTLERPQAVHAVEAA
jgi:glycosyltransferase involved in cell wall biosynthesis